ncbi:MAG TPA: NfeD family protein [Galbitalea sp.]|jgi:membrane protein implicated in regulation of membrane protease activity|nr:NfeD family protein [Galbitalea sp.]
MDFLQMYAWIIWLAVILIFVIIEVITVDFTGLMLAVGGVGGLIVSLFRAPFWVQVLVAAVIALLLLFAVRPPLKRMLNHGSDKAKTLVDALIGQTATVVNDFNGKPNLAKLANGETWTVELDGAKSTKLHEGDHVVVTAINGSTATVALETRTTTK